MALLYSAASTSNGTGSGWAFSVATYVHEIDSSFHDVMDSIDQDESATIL